MAAKKKSTDINNVIETKDNKEITKEQVYDVLKVFEAFVPSGVYSPFMVNSALQNKTLSPLLPTEENVNTALQNPKSNEQQLLGYNEYFELTSMHYKRAMLYYSTMLSYNVHIDCINANSEEDFASKEYKKSFGIVSDFLNMFNIKSQFSMITRQLLRQDVFVGLYREDSEDKYFFQEFPQDRAKITGKWEYGNVTDVDMTYFLNPGVNINMFPDEFKDLFARIYQGNSPKYNPAAMVGYRDGSFAQWAQTDPTKVWTFKFNQEVATRVPFLSAMLQDVVLQPLVRQLQKNINIISATKILAGEVPIKKDGKGTMAQDAIAMSPETLGKFLAVMKAGLGELIKVAAAPLEEIQGVEFDTKDSLGIYDSHNKTIASSAGNSRLIFTSDKSNEVDSGLLMNMDENIIRHLYYQYEDFLNYILKKKIEEQQRKPKYYFRIKLSGFENSVYKKETFDKVKYWAEKGIIDLDSVAHTLGKSNKIELLRAMKETKALGFSELLTVLPNIYNTSKNTEVRNPVDNEEDKKNLKFDK